MIYYGDDFIKEFAKESSCIAYSRQHPKRLCYCKQTKMAYMNGIILQGGGGLSGNASDSNEVMRMDGETLKLYNNKDQSIGRVLTSDDYGQEYHANGSDADLVSAGLLKSVLDYEFDWRDGLWVSSIMPVSGSVTLEYGNLGFYYDISNVLGTLVVQLPNASTIIGNRTKGFVMHFTTGANSALTFTADTSISYFDGYSIEANKEYELNIMWNGSKWIVAYGIIS